MPILVQANPRSNADYGPCVLQIMTITYTHIHIHIHIYLTPIQAKPGFLYQLCSVDASNDGAHEMKLCRS